MLKTLIQLFCRHWYRGLTVDVPGHCYNDGWNWVHQEAIVHSRCIKCGKTIKGPKSEIKARIRRSHR